MNEIRQFQICSNKHETPLVHSSKYVDYMYFCCKPDRDFRCFYPVPTRWKAAERRNKSDAIIMLKWRHHAVSYLSVVGTSVYESLYFDYENALFNEEPKKRIINVRM